jgi:ubiquinone/menaquinone biosynthesis C-methylase UbiE
MPTDKRTIAWYNEFAEDYVKHVRDEDDSVYHSLYEKPAMYGLLPNLKNMKVISIGCGSGEDCNQLSNRGADVTGIDISDKLVAIAKKSYPACDFKFMDMEKLEFPDESFDFAYSSLAIHYLENWTKALKEAYRVLKPGASYLFSCSHPTFSAMSYTLSTDKISKRILSRIEDKTTGVIEVTGNYFDKRRMETNGWITWHKSLSEISSEIASAGFDIELIHEPKPLPKMREVSPADYKVLTKIPNFLILKLRKL